MGKSIAWFYAGTLDVHRDALDVHRDALDVHRDVARNAFFPGSGDIDVHRAPRCTSSTFR